MTLEIDAFTDFFAAVNDGHRPYGWQLRLARRLLDEGRWPDRITAPTGAGKTAVIHAHVFAVAAAGNHPDRPPRRLALVVDRRVLVDDQHRRALELRGLLAGALGSNDVVGVVARRLAALRSDMNAEESPLVVARLRGGVPPETQWRLDPSACAVICATPDMWGSRLLMRGYGSRRGTRPIDAGLLSTDAAVVVDEAHLNRQLVATARRVGHLQRERSREAGITGLPPLACVAMTATSAGGDGADVEAVSAADLEADPDLARRLHRPKPVEIVSDPPSGAKAHARARRVAEIAHGLRRRHGPTVGCFVNTVSAAVAVARELGRRKVCAEIVCGRLRGVDLHELRRRRPGLLEITGNEEVDVLISTQSLEVGVDLDLAAIVTEIAPASSLAQRAGRVNRRGLRATGPVIVVAPEPLDESDRSGPYDGPSLKAARKWLEARAADPAGLSPWSMTVDPPQAPPGRRLHRLEIWDTWLLARTSIEHQAEPDLDLWLSDELSPDLDVGIAARAGLTGDPARDLPLLRAAPVLAPEVFPVPLSRGRRELKEWLDRGTPVYVTRGGEPIAGTGRLAPGDTLIVGTDVDLILHGVVVGAEEADDRAPAEDVMERAAMIEGNRSVRLHPRMPLARQLRAGALERARWELEGVDGDTRAGRDRIATVLRALADYVEGEPAYGDHLRGLAEALLGRLDRFAVRELPLDDAGPVLCITDLRRPVREEEPTATPLGRLSLAAHTAHVEEQVRTSAERIGLPAGLRDVLVHAARWHDRGKDDPRFQRALGRSAGEGEPLAKSGMTRREDVLNALAASGLPPGWPHEQRSAALMQAACRDTPFAALQLRLVGTHHGRGRPTFDHHPDVLWTDPADASACAELFGDGMWEEIVEETDLRYGVWTTAFLEAVLRAADQRASRSGRPGGL